MIPPALIRCAGRPVARDGRPYGTPCGRRYRAPSGPYTHPDETQSARAAGWRISPPAADGTLTATCPSCSRPDPALTALCRDLERSIT